MQQGLILVGTYQGEEDGKAFKTKDGTEVKPRLVAFAVGGLQNVIVEVSDPAIQFSPDVAYKIPVKASAKTWDESTKRYQYVNVRFFIPSGTTID
jgi:hypothetical protein